MSTTPTTPKPAEPATSPRPVRTPLRERPARPARRAGALVRDHSFAVTVAGALALAALTLLYPSTPSYDPWAWIQWGREILHLELDTDTGPSWKPLPVLFTTVFAAFGDAAPDLWLIVARAGGILALVMCFRLARRLTGGGAYGVAAGLVAAAGLLLSTWWLRNTMLGYSEGILIALALFGLERHLDGHRGQAFALGFGAALLRPEVWPFIALYGLWMMWREPRHRGLVVGLGVLTVALWILPEWWGSGQPLRAASRATEVVGGPALSENPAVALVSRARTLVLAPTKLGILLALAFAAWTIVRHRRVPLTVGLAAAGAAWVGIVAVMTQGGFAGNERYLAMPVALGCVVGGVGWGMLGRALANGLARAVPPGRRLAGPIAAVALLAVGLPLLQPRVETLSADDRELRFQGKLRDDLQLAVDRYGGRDRALACGVPYAGAYNVAMVSWMLDVPGRVVEYEPEIPGAAPGVAFRGRSRTRVNPTPALGAGWRPVVHAGEFTVLESCAPGANQR